MIAAVLALLGSCDRTSVNDRPPVELWVVGDDAATLSLRDALESAIDSSPTFRLSKPPSDVAALVITIPRNVEARLEGRQAKIFYTAEYASANGRVIHVGTGSCWEARPAACAAEILRRAAAILANK
jgi:hypothetical protein